MGLFTKKNNGAHQWRGVIEEYRHRLPVSDKTPIVSLREARSVFTLTTACEFPADAWGKICIDFV